jgi:integrase
LPRILTKKPTLNGKADVICFEREPDKWFLRVLIEGTKKYKTKRIPFATTLEEAIEGALDTFISLKDKPEQTIPSKPRRSSQSIDVAIAAYLEHERQRMEAGLCAPSTYARRSTVIGKHLVEYLAFKEITRTSQINDDTFSDYPIFRKQARSTRKAELSLIQSFVSHYLIKHKLITPDVAMSKDLLPKIRMRQSDFDANPAINDEDFKKINYAIRYEYIPDGNKHQSHRVHHARQMMWHFIMVMKNTGCRPNELRKLRWKDVELENVGRWSESKQMEEDRIIAYLRVTDSKTGQQREIPANVGDTLIRWMKYRLSYIKTHMPDLYARQGVNLPDQLVFGNPYNDFKAYDHCTLQQHWNVILSYVSGKLKGHKFSDRKYTLYSLRSTFIENKLIEGMDIFLLARICGHSVKVLMTHYERMDIRKRADEITHIDYGKKGKKTRIVDVLTN